MSDGRIVIDTELNTAEFEGGLKQLNVLTVAAGQVIADVFQMGLKKVGEFAAGAFNVGVSYDTAMSQVAATMGATVDQITDLSTAAQEMGATTKYTATEAAEGINILAMAGLDSAAILAENEKGASILATTLSLASAGAMDMASSATFLTGAVKGFGDEASNAQYYADLMAKGATMANTNVSGLGAALSDAAATASAYGQQADSVTLSLLRLAEQNVTGSGASTALAAAMKNLYTPTAQAKSALDELGVSAYNADGSARDFNEVVDNLTVALSGYSAEEANAYKQTIFGIQGLDAYNKMSITSTEKVDEFRAGLAGASDEFGGMGAAAGQAATQLDNLEGDLTLLSSATDGLSLALYNTFSDRLRNLVSFGTDSVTRLTDALKIGGVSGMLGAAADMGRSLVQGFIQQIPSLLQTGTDMAVSLIQGLASGAAANVSGFIDTALPMLMEFSGQLRANAGQLVDAGLDLIIQLAHGIAAGIPTIIQTIPTIVTNIAGIINDNAPKLLATGFTVLATIGTGILDALPTLLANLPKIVEAIVSVFQAINWLNLGKSILTAIKSGITTIGTELPAALKKIGSDMMQHFKSLDWANTGVAIIEFITHGISSIGSMIWVTLTGLGDTAVELFKSINWIDLGKNLILGIVNGITDAAASAVSALVDFGGKLLDGFKSFFGIHSPSTVMEEQGNFLIEGLVNALTALPGALTGILGNALSALTTWGGNLAKNGLNAAKNTLSNVVNHFRQMPGKVSGQLANTITKVGSWAKTMTGKAKTAASQTLNNVTSSIKQMPGKVGAHLSSTIGKVGSWAQSMTTKAKTAASQTLSNVVSNIGQMPGRVGALLTNVIAKVSSWASSMTSKAKNAASQALSNVVTFFSQMPGKVGAQLTAVISRVSSWASSLVSKMKDAGSRALSGIVQHISQMPGKIASQLSSVLGNVSSWGSSLYSKFNGIGRNAIQGVINGIGSMVGQLYSSIKNAMSGLVSKAKNALGIASPSKVMRDEVGKWIPAGVAEGIKRNMSTVLNATKNMTKGVSTTLNKSKGKKLGEQYAKSIADAVKGEKKNAKKSASELGEIIVETAEKKLSNYKIIHSTTLDYEVGFWKQILTTVAKGSQAYYDAFKKYSDAQKEYAEASAQTKADLLELEQNYAKNISAVQTNLVNDMNELWDTYHETVAKRSQTLYKALGGPFEAFASKTENTTETLVTNLTSQVDAMKQWRSDLAKLEKRKVASGLLDELRELGPDAAADVHLLTQMTDEELKQYVQLWKDKITLCDTQATAENRNLYQSTMDQVKQLKEDASAEMSAYTKGFVASVKALAEKAKKELGTLPASFGSIGKQAMAGITAAIREDSGALNREIQTAMTKAVKAAKTALKIKSPSKVMRDEVGAMIPEGAAVGVKKRSSALYRQMDTMSNELVRHARLPDLSGYMDTLRNFVAADVGSVTLQAVATTSSAAGVVPGVDNRTDYKKLSEHIVGAFAAAGIKVNLNHRELGRLIAEKG